MYDAKKLPHFFDNKYTDLILINIIFYILHFTSQFKDIQF